MRNKLRAIVIAIICTLTLSQQPPIISQAREVKVDSIQYKINVLKPKIDSSSLFDSLQVYTTRMDSVKIDSKKTLEYLLSQQKRIEKQLKAIDTITKNRNE